MSARFSRREKVSAGKLSSERMVATPPDAMTAWNVLRRSLRELYRPTANQVNTATNVGTNAAAEATIGSVGAPGYLQTQHEARHSRPCSRNAAATSAVMRCTSAARGVAGDRYQILFVVGYPATVATLPRVSTSTQLRERRSGWMETLNQHARADHPQWRNSGGA